MKKNFSSNKRWFIVTCIMISTCLVLVASITVLFDPYFHYHAPLEGWAYRIYNERYQNDGIIKHFSYDTMITGTSMTQNFKTTEFDALWGTQSIKVPFAGAGFKELGENLRRAAKANPNLKYVVLGLDANTLIADKDWSRYDSYPTYLYDNNIFNDVFYVLNKEVLLQDTLQNVILLTMHGGHTTTFDAYNNWMQGYTFGKAAVLGAAFEFNITRAEEQTVTQDDLIVVEQTLKQNYIPVIKENPHITFYIFYPPYSIYYFYELVSNGTLKKQLAQMEYATELLLQFDNVQLFSFFDEYEMIGDLDNYKDSIHYHEDVNSQMLKWMKAGDHMLTKETYQEHFRKLSAFYDGYDYETAFKVSE